MARVKTLEEKLKSRIEREFPKKKLIGDISISDDEFQILVARLRSAFNLICTSYSHSVSDPMMCVALVQIGIRCYDGNYWNHVKDCLRTARFDSTHQKWLGMSFMDTMRSKNKLLLANSDRVDNILMHGFVSNYYAGKMFDFLFAFYRIDIERDIQRLDRSMMQSLVEAIQSSDNRGRTYWLVEQTADAVRMHPRGAKTRIRRFLKLLDNAFWGDPLPTNTQNRLTRCFLAWKDSSENFLSVRDQYSDPSVRSRKNFFSPYLELITTSNSVSFQLILPSQLLRNDSFTRLYWSVTVEGTSRKYESEPDVIEGVTGYKADRKTIRLERSDIFSTIECRLMADEKKLRSFSIPKDSIRFFTAEGASVQPDALHPGTVYSFTPSGYTPESSAEVATERLGKVMFTAFDLAEGDVIFLPDGRLLSVGGKPKEGLLMRGLVKGAMALDSESQIPVYSEAPSVFFTMPKKREPGTAVEVNGKKFRLSECVFKYCSLAPSRLNEEPDCSYLVNLGQFRRGTNGICEVKVDIPNDRSVRSWKFMLLQGFSFSFEDSPYIFQARGTMCVKGVSGLVPPAGVKVNGSNFDFEIVPGEPDLILRWHNIPLRFEIPAFSYQFGDGPWQTAPHVDIWHKAFQPKLRIRYPGSQIKVLLKAAESEESGHRELPFTKIRSKNLFECDLTPFLSWFGRDQVRRQISVDLMDGNTCDLLGVIVRSNLISGTLRGDFQRHRLIGEFNITGESTYYVSLHYEGSPLAEYIPLTYGLLVVDSDLKSGKYEAVVYESAEDDTGFGDDVFEEVGVLSLDLLNPQDLSGKSIWIRTIRPTDDASSHLPLKYKYTVDALRIVSEQDKHIYRGKMVVSGYGSERILATFPVQVEFYDLDKLSHVYITFYDEDDPTEFLYDEKSRIIVKQEDPNLSKSQAYRRYKQSLYPGDYDFEIGFVDALNLTEDYDDSEYNNLNPPAAPAPRAVSASAHSSMVFVSSPRNVPIEDMGLTQRSFNCLLRANLRTSGGISKTTARRIQNVRNLGHEGVKEVAAKMKKLGYAEWAAAALAFNPGNTSNPGNPDNFKQQDETNEGGTKA